MKKKKKAKFNTGDSDNNQKWTHPGEATCLCQDGNSADEEKVLLSNGQKYSAIFINTTS